MTTAFYYLARLKRALSEHDGYFARSVGNGALLERHCRRSDLIPPRIELLLCDQNRGCSDGRDFCFYRSRFKSFVEIAIGIHRVGLEKKGSSVCAIVFSS